MHHLQPAPSIAIVPNRLTLLAAACNATPSRNVVERIMGHCSTRNGSVCHPSCVSSAPLPPPLRRRALDALRARASAAPPARFHLSDCRHRLCSYPVSPSCSNPFPFPAWALARVAAGPRDNYVLHIPIHLVPTRRKPPFHFDFLIRPYLFHKQEGSCKRP